MRDKDFRFHLETLIDAVTDPEVIAHASFACPDLVASMRDLASTIDVYLNHKEYTREDFAGDVLTLMEFFSSDEVEKYSKGSEIQLQALLSCLISYADSLDCFDVAQDD